MTGPRMIIWCLGVPGLAHHGSRKDFLLVAGAVPCTGLFVPCRASNFGWARIMPSRPARTLCCHSLIRGWTPTWDGARRFFPNTVRPGSRARFFPNTARSVAPAGRFWKFWFTARVSARPTPAALPVASLRASSFFWDRDRIRKASLARSGFPEWLVRLLALSCTWSVLLSLLSHHGRSHHDFRR